MSTKEIITEAVAAIGMAVGLLVLIILMIIIGG